MFSCLALFCTLYVGRLTMLFVAYYLETLPPCRCSSVSLYTNKTSFPGSLCSHFSDWCWNTELLLSESYKIKIVKFWIRLFLLNKGGRILLPHPCRQALQVTLCSVHKLKPNNVRQAAVPIYQIEILAVLVLSLPLRLHWELSIHHDGDSTHGLIIRLKTWAGPSHPQKLESNNTCLGAALLHEGIVIKPHWHSEISL